MSYYSCAKTILQELILIKAPCLTQDYAWILGDKDNGSKMCETGEERKKNNKVA
jgi:hypothetical protein